MTNVNLRVIIGSSSVRYARDLLIKTNGTVDRVDAEMCLIDYTIIWVLIGLLTCVFWVKFRAAGSQYCTNIEGTLCSYWCTLPLFIWDWLQCGFILQFAFQLLPGVSSKNLVSFKHKCAISMQRYFRFSVQYWSSVSGFVSAAMLHRPLLISLSSFKVSSPMSFSSWQAFLAPTLTTRIFGGLGNISLDYKIFSRLEWCPHILSLSSGNFYNPISCCLTLSYLN